jgi:PAS domain S-box-containing protein
LGPLTKTRAFPFLQNGGEMGELTRRYDWSQTPLGPPDEWPLVLRTTVAMILSSRFPMFLWWGKDMIQFYNDAYRPSLGNDGKHPGALGQKAVDCWPEIWDVIYPLISQVQSTGEATWNEDQLIPIYRNGKIEDVYWTFGYSPIFGESDEVEGVLVVCQEITQKVQNRQKLEESEARLHALIAAAPVAIGLFVGRDLIVEMYNQTFIDIVGKGPNLTGRPLAEVMPELITENQPFLQILDDVYTSGKVFQTFGAQVDIVQNGIMKQGFYDFSYTPLFDAEGKVYAILDIAIDVTEQVIASKRLAQSEQNLRNIILKAPVAMCILKGSAHVVEIANERMIELWGKKAAEVMNKPIFEGLPEAKDQGFEQALHQVFTTGETFIAYGVPVTLPRNGEIQPVYINFMYEAYRENGIISGIIAVATEVTEQMVAQQKIEEVVTQRTKELAEANKALQQTNQELEQFAYIASHDMQEPLRKVITFSNMLESRLDPIDERSKNYLNKIAASTTRMSQLIYDVLNFSKLSKEGELSVATDLNTVLENITDDFELLIEQKKAIIHIDRLPVLQAVPLQMQQLFSNLVSNALKFSRADVSPEITITSRRLSEAEVTEHQGLLPKRAYYLIQVMDNGIGFKQEHAQQIFHIFQRLHVKTEYSGTGIGLALCKKIVQNHQGEIWAEAIKGKGAVFNVILPGKT